MSDKALAALKETLAEAMRELIGDPEWALVAREWSAVTLVTLDRQVKATPV